MRKLAVLLVAGLVSHGADAAWPTPDAVHTGGRWAVLCWPVAVDGINPLSTTSYVIHRSENGVDFTRAGMVDGVNFISPTASRGQGFLDPGLVFSRTYTYRIQALHASGTTYSDSVTAALGPASIPFGLTVAALAGNGFIRLDWSTDPAVTGESTVDEYRIFRATHPDAGSWAEVGTVTQGTFVDFGDDPATSGVFEVLVPGERYAYLIFPCCPMRCPWFVFATPSVPAEGQGVPTARTDAAAGPRSVRINWECAAPGTFPTSAYAVFRSDDGGASFNEVGRVPDLGQCPGAIFDFVDVVPRFGQRYFYVIRPVDALGSLGVAYRTVVIDVELPITRLFLNLNMFRPLNGEELDVVFQLTEPGEARIGVYTPTGEKIRSLYRRFHAERAFTPEQPFNSRDEGLVLTWDGTNDRGELVASGVYLLVVELNAERDIRTIAVIR